MNEEAKKARNEYMRKWREKNKDKVKAITSKYWERKVEKKEHAPPDQE